TVSSTRNLQRGAALLSLVVVTASCGGGERASPPPTTSAAPPTTSYSPPLPKPKPPTHREPPPVGTGTPWENGVDRVLRKLPRGNLAFNAPTSLRRNQIAEVHLIVSLR